MSKHSILIICIAVAAVCLLPNFVFAEDAIPQTVSGAIQEVNSGDMFTFFDKTNKRVIICRLDEVQCPLSGEKGFDEARKYLLKYWNQPITAKVISFDSSHGMYYVKLIDSSGVSINDLVKKNGYGKSTQPHTSTVSNGNVIIRRNNSSYQEYPRSGSPYSGNSGSNDYEPSEHQKKQQQKMENAQTEHNWQCESILNNMNKMGINARDRAAYSDAYSACMGVTPPARTEINVWH